MKEFCICESYYKEKELLKSIFYLWFVLLLLQISPNLPFTSPSELAPKHTAEPRSPTVHGGEKL